ncbi:13455_t:CDS:2 [Entrophospora sp. SA101]|nr:13455_t:CDS:2 [Entrophospora sp. SA101]
MNVVQTSSNMDAHSFENPNLSTVLTAPPMIIMSRSKECHVRGVELAIVRLMVAGLSVTNY